MGSVLDVAVSLQRKTPMKRSATPMKRSPMKRTKSPRQSRPKRQKRSPNEFPDDVKLAARRRSGGRCEARSNVCDGTAAHFHHRKLRRHKDQRLVNCLHVCGSCHRHIHDQVGVSYLLGWLVHSYADPAGVPARLGTRGR